MLLLVTGLLFAVNADKNMDYLDKETAMKLGKSAPIVMCIFVWTRKGTVIVNITH